MREIKSVPVGLLAGISYPFRALALINRNRRLWGYVLIPILVNGVVGIALYAGLYLAGLRQIDRLDDAGGTLLVLFAGLIKFFYIVGLALGVGWLMVRFGVVLGAPWYGRLAEQMEQIVTGRPAQASKLTVGNVAYDIWRALQFELKKLLLVLVIGLPSLLLNFVPVAGTVLATIVAIALGAVVACLDFFDATLERRRLSFRAKLDLIRNAMPASASFGLLAAFMVSIPLVNLLAIPLCVAAGTLLTLESGLLTRSVQRPDSPASVPVP